MLSWYLCSTNEQLEGLKIDLCMFLAIRDQWKWRLLFWIVREGMEGENRWQCPVTVGRVTCRSTANVSTAHVPIIISLIPLLQMTRSSWSKDPRKDGERLPSSYWYFVIFASICKYTGWTLKDEQLKYFNSQEHQETSAISNLPH